MPQTSLSPRARRVQNILAAVDSGLTVVELPQSTSTAGDAADSLGCEIAQIAKTLVFKAESTETAIIAVASGINQVDMAKLSAASGDSTARADADFVKQQTGYSIGGVAPVGLPEAIPVFIDEDLLGLDFVYAAAGTSHAVFRLDPARLPDLSGGRVINLKKS